MLACSRLQLVGGDAAHSFLIPEGRTAARFRWSLQFRKGEMLPDFAHLLGLQFRKGEMLPHFVDLHRRKRVVDVGGLQVVVGSVL